MNNTQTTGFDDWLGNTRPGFEYYEKEGIGLYGIRSFMDSGLVRHGFTTRVGGVSKGSFAGLNMSWTRTDSLDNTRRNYELAAGALGIDPADMVVVDGDHGTTIRTIEAGHRSSGLYLPWPEGGDKFDGMCTDQAGIALCTIHGDCTPIFLLDRAHKAICMCHSGWRGTIAGMPGEAVRCMVERYGSRVEDLLVGVGPSIGACCFEVQEDVAARFEGAFPQAGCVLAGAEAEAEHGEKPLPQPRVDLLRVTAWQLYEVGLPAANVTISGLCTCCDAERFHSFRRDGRAGGSMAGILQLIK